MIPYILYASLILTASLFFYKLLLQKETFFRLNRYVLLTCMALAFVLPLLRVPQEMSLRKIQPAIEILAPSGSPGNIAGQLKSDLPSIGSQTAEKQAPGFKEIRQWVIYLYWFGVIIFGLNFFMQAILLLFKAYSRPMIRDGKFRIVEIASDKPPCSFGNNIFINPERYDWQTYTQVLLHEKIHIEQRHTLDLLFAEIVLVFQWFNPFAWWWRKELESNLEFLTDNKLLQHNTIEKESYQLSLFKVAAPYYPLSLTTNYNQSLLKKRLLMMNAKKSNVHTIWKYFFLAPVMVLFVCLFNEPVVKSQSLSTRENTKNNNHGESGIETNGNWFATIKDDHVTIQFKQGKEDNSYSGNTFKLNEFKDLEKDKTGTFSLNREAGVMEFKGKFTGNTGSGTYNFTADKDYQNNLNKEGIELATDRDALVFFLVNIKLSYVAMLKKQGYTDLNNENLVAPAALNIDEAYINSIKQAGFKDISLENLVPLKALNVTKAYIEEIREAGYKDVTPDKIITFKAQGIDGKYIADYRRSTKSALPAKSAEEAPANKTGNNANKNKNEDSEKNGDNDEDEIIAFKSMNIDQRYINSFKEAGYTNLSSSDLISMKALGVTADFAKSFTQAGYANIKADDLVALKSQDVTPALIQQYKQLGFDKINLDDVIGAKATGTSPFFIKSMRQKGHNMKSLDKYIALKAVLGAISY